MYGRLGVKSDQNLIDAFEHFVLEDCEDIKMSRMLKATLSRCTQYTNTQYFFLVYTCIRGKGGAVVRALASHQCGPGSNPGVDAICGLSLLLVLSPAPKGFSPGTPVFPSPQKPTIPNSNSIWNARTRVNEFRHMNS